MVTKLPFLVAESVWEKVTTDREDWGDNLSPAEFMRAIDIVSSRLRVTVNEVDHFYRFSGGDWEADTAEELAEMMIGCWREESHMLNVHLAQAGGSLTGQCVGKRDE